MAETVTYSLTGAVFADDATLSGSWTSSYNTTGTLVSVPALDLTLSGTIDGVLEATVFSNGRPNTATGENEDIASANSNYEIQAGGSNNGDFDQLFIDFSGTTPSTIFLGKTDLQDGTYFQYTSEVDSSGQTQTLASAGTLTTQANGFVLCYLAGTLIATPAGEVAVEDLRHGDLVLTRYNGILPVKWIGRQSYAPPFLTRLSLPVRIAPGALGNDTPSRPLWVSPGHSMLIDNQLVLARNLVNGVNVAQAIFTENVDYYAVELEHHDCIVADGAWGETYADAPGLRNQFHNAAEFRELYPDHEEPRALHLCAPRPEAGAELEAALMPLVSGLPITPGPLRSRVEIMGPHKIEGWAFDIANPDTPVIIEIATESELLGTALACHYRPDLAAAGYGRGHCMFSFALPKSVSEQLSIRRASDGAALRVSGVSAAAA